MRALLLQLLMMVTLEWPFWYSKPAPCAQSEGEFFKCTVFPCVDAKCGAQSGFGCKMEKGFYRTQPGFKVEEYMAKRGLVTKD